MSTSIGTPADAAPGRPTVAASDRARAAVLPRRLPILVLGVLSLLAGLWGGLLLLGLPLPTARVATAADHGPLMALGFLGTVISLERAVALRQAWAFAAPVAAGAGGLVLLVGLPSVLGWGLLCFASVVFVMIYAVVLRIQPMLHLVVMTAGAVCWYLATVFWLGGFEVPRLVPWLVGFLVFTILGERLELARVALLTRTSVRVFAAGATTFAAGLALSAVTGRVAEIGVRLAGVGLLALAAWGARHDVARRTVKIAGVTRYMAVSLLAGYVWLLVGGATWLLAGDLGRTDHTYDVALHAVFLGFVMSMVFAHAPVIVPAVLGVRLPFSVWFYCHVALLHLALLVRLVAGDGLGNEIAWQVGGVGTELAILLFLGVSAATVIGTRRTTARAT